MPDSILGRWLDRFYSGADKEQAMCGVSQLSAGQLSQARHRALYKA